MITRTARNPAPDQQASAHRRARDSAPGRPSRRARIAARVRAASLDRALIAGADPAAGPALAARASLLTSRTRREQLAEGLERLVGAAQGRQRRWWDLAQREAVLVNSSEPRAAAMALRSARPLYAAGLARLNQLLADGTGPAYRGSASGLARALSDARAALEGCG